MLSTLTRILPVTTSRRQGLFASIATAMRLQRSRRALGSLDASRLEDIGISRAEACAEARRAAWDAPQNWLK